MNFTKMQGTGNDFILVEANHIKRNWPRMAVAMCHRRLGIGGDGLILVMPSKIADFRMRIFNADGSEAEMCGNGIRCVARFVFEKGLVSGENKEITVQTLAGIKKIGLRQARGKLATIRVGMGKPELDVRKIPVAIDPDDLRLASRKIQVKGKSLQLHFVSMGNPHAVYFSDQPVEEFPLTRFGPEVEWHDIFPNRINFEVVKLLDKQTIEARVWERGAGETSACGTGACAVAVAAKLLGYTGNKVDIKLPGGMLGVEWDGSGEVFLTGPAETVFNGDWPE